MLKVLWQGNFALFWSAGLVSTLGDVVLFIALPFGIYVKTGSTAATGTLFIVESLPRVLLGACAGVFADRWDRQRTLVSANLLRALLLLPLLVIQTSSTVWLVYPIAFSVQVVGQFFAPAAGALLPSLIAACDRPAANAWFGLSSSFTLLAGPSLGGFLLGVAGWSSIILTDSCSFVLSAALIGCISLQAPPPAAETARHPSLTSPGVSFWRDWVAGLRTVARTQMLLALFAVGGLGAMAGGCFTVLMVPYVHDLLHGPCPVARLASVRPGRREYHGRPAHAAPRDKNSPSHASGIWLLPDRHRPPHVLQHHGAVDRGGAVAGGWPAAGRDWHRGADLAATRHRQFDTRSRTRCFGDYQRTRRVDWYEHRLCGRSSLRYPSSTRHGGGPFAPDRHPRPLGSPACPLDRIRRPAHKGVKKHTWYPNMIAPLTGGSWLPCRPASEFRGHRAQPRQRHQQQRPLLRAEPAHRVCQALGTSCGKRRLCL